MWRSLRVPLHILPALALGFLVASVDDSAAAAPTISVTPQAISLSAIEGDAPTQRLLQVNALSGTVMG